MTLPFQQHQKIRQSGNHRQNSNQVSSSSLDILRDKPFWIFDKTEHLQKAIESKSQCCAQHILGLPIKNGKSFPLFDYQKLIFDAIENNQNIWILKSRGIGLTTFMIRYFAWKILSSSELDGKSIFIVSGTREEHANYIKEKLEQLFESEKFQIKFESKYTELLLNKTWIKVFPTRNIKDIRGYFEASYIFVDEADYLEESIQDELMSAISPYEEKSNCKIILCSTPFKPQGLMQRIEKDVNSKYVKLKLDYRYGLDKIYDRSFIESKKLEHEFSREYDLAYLGKIGNLYSPFAINKCIELGIQDGYDTNLLCPTSQWSLGIDPAFGSSSFGIVLLELLDSKLYVKIAEQHRAPTYESMIERIVSILKSHNRFSVYQDTLHSVKVFVDASNPAIIKSLKRIVGEEDSSTYIQDRILDCKKYDRDLSEDMIIVPVPFNPEARSLLYHSKLLVEHEKVLVRINNTNDKFQDLVTALRTATIDSSGKLDKNESVYNDLTDAFILACRLFRLKNKQQEQESRPIMLFSE